MKPALLLASLLALVAPARAQQAILLVRHAEKVDDADDSPLSAAGVQRARRLADHLRSASVTAIYATQFRRTIDTARPLADRLELKVRSVPDSDTPGLVSKLRSAHADDVVLVSAHTHTIPEILRRLGHVAHVEIPPAEYDNLFVIVPRPGRPPVVTRLRY